MSMKLIRVFTAVICTSVLVACGGGSDTASVPRTTAVVTPTKKATTVTGGNAVVIHMYQALYGMAPSNALLVDYAFQANNDASTFVKNLTDRFASTSHADLAKLVLDNLGVTPTTVPAINAKGESEYSLLLDAVKQLFGAYPTMRGQVILNMTNLLAALESDVTYGAAAVAYNGQAQSNIGYSSNDANTSSALSSSQEVACTYVKPATITYPSEYNGTSPIPTPIGKLPATLTRIVGLKDYYPTYRGLDQIPKTSECSNYILYARNLYIEDLKRLQQLNVDETWIYNYGQWNDITTPIWYVDKVNYSIKESEVKFVVDEARKRNIKVNLTWQFTNNDMAGHSISMFDAVFSMSLLKQMLDSFHIQIVNQARYANQIGVAGISVDWSGIGMGNIKSDSGLRELYVTEMVNIIRDIRGVFSGTLYYGGASWDAIIDPRIVAKVDRLVLQLSTWVPPDHSPTVEEAKGGYIYYLSKLKSDYDKQMNGAAVDIPVAFEVKVQSTRTFLSTGWIEDGGCSSNMDSTCYQRGVVIDFSMQAIGVEALFEALASQISFSNVSSINFETTYWHTDDLVPTSYGNGTDWDFPNISQSFRNKPAEGIVKYWFGR